MPPSFSQGLESAVEDSPEPTSAMQFGENAAAAIEPASSSTAEPGDASTCQPGQNATAESSESDTAMLRQRIWELLEPIIATIPSSVATCPQVPEVSSADQRIAELTNNIADLQQQMAAQDERCNALEGQIDDAWVLAERLRKDGQQHEEMLKDAEAQRWKLQESHRQLVLGLDWDNSQQSDHSELSTACTVRDLPGASRPVSAACSPNSGSFGCRDLVWSQRSPNPNDTGWICTTPVAPLTASAREHGLS